MRHTVIALLVSVLSGCFVDAYPELVAPGVDVVYVSDDTYYREVYIHGEMHRFYYHWRPRHGWTYHGRFIVHGHRR